LEGRQPPGGDVMDGQYDELDGEFKSVVFCRVTKAMKERLRQIAKKQNISMNLLMIGQFEELIEADKRLNQLNYPNRFE
jgi:hypothetical protein